LSPPQAPLADNIQRPTEQPPPEPMQ
jgi:hypothetical protein